MSLIHKTVRLRRDSYIRIIGSKCVIPTHPSIYQYVVDMLFPDNNWQRIFVSRLYHDVWEMLLAVNGLAENSKTNFKVKFLTKQAREKYGQEQKIKDHRVTRA